MNNEELNKIMQEQLKNNYKTLCDKIKVMLLDKLIDLGIKNNKSNWNLTELIIIRDGVNEEIDKDKAEQVEAIAEIINNIIGRFGSEKPTSKEEPKDG